MCVCLYIYAYVYVYVYVYNCKHIYPSIYPSIHPSIHLSYIYLWTIHVISDQFKTSPAFLRVEGIVVRVLLLGQFDVAGLLLQDFCLTIIGSSRYTSGWKSVIQWGWMGIWCMQPLFSQSNSLQMHGRMLFVSLTSKDFQHASTTHLRWNSHSI